MPLSSHSADGRSRTHGPLPFVGRDDELRWLTDAMDVAAGGHPQAVLLIGDAGIGKTRMLRELETLASKRGFGVAVGRGREGVVAPFLPLAEALAPWSQELPAFVLRHLGIPGGGRGAAADDPWGDTATGSDDPRALVATARAILGLAARRPVLAVIDDLHWVDHASLDLVAHLVFAAGDAATRERLPFLVALATRAGEDDERLGRTLGRFAREPICRTVDLGGLDDGGIAQLVKAIGQRRPSHQLVEIVRQTTRGNPLFVQEIVDHLDRRGGIEVRGGTLAIASGNSPATALPADLRAAIDTRLADLHESTRAMLSLVAVAGDAVTHGTITAALGLQQGELAASLHEASERRVVIDDGGTVRFFHPMVRHVLYARLDAPARRRLHLAVAQALRSEPPADDTLVRAPHLLAAEELVDAGERVRVARAAGDAAGRAGAWFDAARYYETALQIGTGLSPGDRALLHYRAGFAHYRDQDAGPCLDQFERAVDAYRALDDPAGLARAVMGHTRARFTLASVGYGALIDPAPLQEVRARLGDDEPELAGFVSSELAQVYWTARRPEEAAAMAREALAIAERTRNGPLAAEAHRALALVEAQTLNPRATRDHLAAGLDWARRSGERWLEGQLLQRQPLALHWLGRFDLAQRAAREATTLAEALHDWSDRSLAHGALACIAVAQGDFEQAERQTHLALSMCRRSGYPWAAPTALPALASARAMRGAWGEADDALALLAEPGQIFDDPGPDILGGVFVLRQLVAGLTDPSDAARASLRQRLAPFGSRIVREAGEDVHTIGFVAALVEIADVSGAAELAAATVDVLTRAVERGMLFSSSWVVLLPRALGTAATLGHDWTRACAWFERAVAEARRRGARPEEARSLLGWARALVARGRRADRPTARTMIEQALPIARELGMKPFVHDAEQLLAVVDETPSVPAGSTVPSSTLTAREAAVQRMLVRGATDAEIATALVLAPATVERLVRHVLRTVGAATRAETTGPAGTRPTVILFTDVVGSTELYDRLGDVLALAVLRTHDEIVDDVLLRTGGTRVKHTGDGTMARFASAASALDAAVQMQRRFAAVGCTSAPGEAIRVRIGINAGEPIFDGDDLFGVSVIAAARLCALARPGRILVSDVVRQLAAGSPVRFVDRGRVTLRGIERRVAVFEVEP
jgi:class 3 adenylate cyclase/tetratricopeptide (TPR) repeat protein